LSTELFKILKISYNLNDISMKDFIKLSGLSKPYVFMLEADK